jgi:signal transduction histidine kinase
MASGLLVLLHALVWRVQREPWSLFFAVAYLLIGVVYVFDAELQPVAGRPNMPASLLGLVAAVMNTLAFIRYFAVPARLARRLDTVAIAVGVLLAGGVLAGLIGRLAGFIALSGYLALQASLALWARQREPQHGHGLIFAAQMLYPALIAAAVAGWVELSLLRYVVIVPVLVTGMTVLTTGLLRAQRHAAEQLLRRQRAESDLKALNESLEHRVAQQTAELHEVVAGLESFNRSVSHDLRGPLGGIAGVSRLAAEALERGDTANAQRMLQVIATQADASSQLVTDLLALARVGEAHLSPQPIALDAFLRDTLEHMRIAQPGQAPLPVTLGELPTVEADPGLLRQVYVNLLGNALKFSRDASPPQIEVGALVQDGGHVLYVRDNGIGFPQDQAERLFQPFQRLHGQHYAGHGVGLSIVKRIVERHGGRLWAQARPDAGATFFFQLGER